MQFDILELNRLQNLLSVLNFTVDPNNKHKWHHDRLTVVYKPGEEDDVQDLFFFVKQTDERKIYATIAPSGLHEVLGAIKAMLSVV